jgi:hypothetical protein
MSDAKSVLLGSPLMQQEKPAHIPIDLASAVDALQLDARSDVARNPQDLNGTQPLYVDRVAKVDVAESLAPADTEVLGGQFEKANEHAVRRDADDGERLRDEPVQVALRIHGAARPKEDADVREPLRVFTVGAAQEPMRLMNDQRDVPVCGIHLERADDGIVDALEEVRLVFR